MKEKSPGTIRDILSEISVCLRIIHPNIVRLCGVEIHGVIRDLAYFNINII